MSEMKKFEDSPAWQKARQLTKEVYQATQQGMFAKDFGLAGQIQRAAVSVMSNIAEGFDRDSQAEFSHFLAIAKASCSEVRSQLYVALDVNYIDQPTFNQLPSRAEETSKVISGFRAAIERNRKLATAASQQTGNRQNGSQ